MNDAIGVLSELAALQADLTQVNGLGASLWASMYSRCHSRWRGRYGTRRDVASAAEKH